MYSFVLKTALFASCLGVGAQVPALVHRIEKPLAAGGHVALRLASGNYEVLPGAADRIVVSWNDPSWKKPEVHLESTGSVAELRISHTPNGDFHVRVEVPPTCDIRARLTAGTLEIGALQGDKDIESHVGEILIAIGETGAYAMADASVGVGELTARPFKEKRGGFFRSFHWSGTGSQHLHAKTGIGSITFR